MGRHTLIPLAFACDVIKRINYAGFATSLLRAIFFSILGIRLRFST